MFHIKKTLTGVGLGIATMVALALPTSSFAISWNFACSSGCSALDGADGNERTFTSGSDVLTVRAFSTTNTNGTGNFVASFLGWYGGGLGVTAPGSQPSGDGSGSSNQHTVDNYGTKDLVVFKFPDAFYVPTSVVLTAFGDTDITAYIGGNGKSFSDFTSMSYANLTSNGFTACTAGNSGTSSDRTATLSPPCNLSGQYLIVGANNTQTDDLFKIKSLNGTEVRVPEPSTMFLLGFGLIGLRLFISYRSSKMKQLPVKAL